MLTSALPWLLLDPLLLPISYAKLRWVQLASVAALLPTNALRWVGERKGSGAAWTAPGGGACEAMRVQGIACNKQSAFLPACLCGACRCPLTLTQCPAAPIQLQAAAWLMGALARLASPVAPLLDVAETHCSCVALMCYWQVCTPCSIIS